jgi:hypothetical protein
MMPILEPPAKRRAKELAEDFRQQIEKALDAELRSSDNLWMRQVRSMNENTKGWAKSSDAWKFVAAAFFLWSVVTTGALVYWVSQ